MQSRSNSNLSGIDISNYDTGINYDGITAKVVYMRASEGSTGDFCKDPVFTTHNAECRNRGHATGAYHFVHFYPQSTIQAQVDNFLGMISGQTLNCPIALDCEEDSIHGVDAATITAQALEWAQKVRAATGVEVIVYADSNFIQNYFTDDIKALRLWIADYRYGTAPGENGKAESWIGFQYSDKGNICGTEVDLDEFTPDIILPVYTYGVPAAAQAVQAAPPQPVDNGSRSAPAFPLPADSYFGPASGPAESVSGYYSHSEDLRQWQQRMYDRGWDIEVDGKYGDQTASIARKFQQEKGYTVDGLIGPQTWAGAWTEPIT